MYSNNAVTISERSIRPAVLYLVDTLHCWYHPSLPYVCVCNPSSYIPVYKSLTFHHIKDYNWGFLCVCVCGWQGETGIKGGTS